MTTFVVDSSVRLGQYRDRSFPVIKVKNTFYFVTRSNAGHERRARSEAQDEHDALRGQSFLLYDGRADSRPI